jgi:hypothetical protein
VKTLDLAVTTAAALCVVTLLGASSWSPDTTWYRFNVFGQVLVFPCFLFLYLWSALLEILLTTLYRFGRCGFIYKAGECLFRGDKG